MKTVTIINKGDWEKINVDFHCSSCGCHFTAEPGEYKRVIRRDTSEPLFYVTNCPLCDALTVCARGYPIDTSFKAVQNDLPLNKR